MKLGVTAVVLVAWTARPFREAVDLQVTTASVTRGPVARRIVAAGTLQPAATVDVGTALPGVIRSIEASATTPVREGQVLARLDPAPYRAALDRTQAALAKAE